MLLPQAEQNLDRDVIVDHTLSFLLLLALVILAAKAAGLLSTRLGQPAVLGELLVGLILGPTAIDLLSRPPFDSPYLAASLADLAQLGVIFLMFIAGLETDLAEMRRAGRVAIVGGTLGVVAPLALGAAVAGIFAFSAWQALFVGLILTATSVSISAQTLMELGVIKSREGVALLGAAVVDDVLVILLLSLFIVLTADTGSAAWGALGGAAIRVAFYLAMAAIAGWLLLPHLTRQVARLPVSKGITAFVIVTALFYAWAAEAVGSMAAITGAFLAGLAFSSGPESERIETDMRTITYGLLVPIFFVSIGLQANGRALSGGDLAFAVAIILVAIVSKILGCGLGALWGGMDRQAALRVGVGMISRGEVGLIVAGVGLNQGLISAQTFTVMVITVLATTLVTPLLLRLTFPRKEEIRV